MFSGRSPGAGLHVVPQHLLGQGTDVLPALLYQRRDAVGRDRLRVLLFLGHHLVHGPPAEVLKALLGELALLPGLRGLQHAPHDLRHRLPQLGHTVHGLRGGLRGL